MSLTFYAYNEIGGGGIIQKNKNKKNFGVTYLYDDYHNSPFFMLKDFFFVYVMFLMLLHYYWITDPFGFYCQGLLLWLFNPHLLTHTHLWPIIKQLVK